PVHRGQVDPSLELERIEVTLGPRHVDGPRLGLVLGPAGELDPEGARGQGHGLAALAVDLRVEEEIGGQAAAGRGINAAQGVAEDEGGHARPSVLVPDVEDDRDGRLAVEEDVDVAAEAQVLRPLADVEADLRLALPGVPAIDLDDAIFDAEARE